MRAITLSILSIFAFVGSTEARDISVRQQFRNLHACPVTLKTRGPCPGFVVDHMIPLCAGGPDTIANMQWQDVRTSYAKDNVERTLCRRLKACTL